MSTNECNRAAGERKWMLSAVLMAALFLTACEGITTISDVQSDPSKFHNKTVRVMGTVTNSVGLLSTGGYEVEDETGKIFVISNQGVPARGAKVVVEGSVFPGAMVLGQAVGVAIKETKHQIR